MKHVIRKQVIDLHLSAEHNAFTVQQQAKAYFYDHIAPVLEQVLDELSRPEEMLTIDKLEINLGKLSWTNHKLMMDSNELYRVIRNSTTELLSSELVDIKRDAVVGLMNIEKHACLQWLYYLKNGVLPWGLQKIEESWLKQVLHQLAIDPLLIEETKTRIKDHSSFLSRLVRDHSDAFLQQLAGIIAAKPMPNLIKLIGSEHTLWEGVLRQIVDGVRKYESEAILPRIPPVVQNQEGLRENSSELIDGVYCPLAGLVLLHPFFKHLFTHLNLLDEGLFINFSARQKAVILLYFAANGHTAAKDFELTAAKILCGMSSKEVLDGPAYELTEEEKVTTIQMIKAAIDQWPIMQTASVEAIQEGFLRRKGKIIKEQQDILFRIKASGIDVLLDRLPWNLSIIKFPWQDQLFRIDWR